ncbi:MAG: DUF4249 family protein [Candidatus Marinimicrobia bacterium]|nr:DUF4249 family protein [Candidatus Neomarinimicrobiota bacterium]
MSFSKYIKLFISVFIIFLTACEVDNNWEKIEADYNPELIVFGLISLDPEIDSFVKVYRTLELSEESEIVINNDTIESDGNIYIFSNYEPAGLIKNAEVSIISNGNSIPFNFVSSRPYEREKNYYLDTLGTFTPQPGTIYSLNVTVPGYPSVKGELLSPEIPVLIDSLIQDTISIKRDYDIVWEKLNNGKGILTGRLGGEKDGEVSDSFIDCNPNLDRVVDIQDGSYTVVAKICDDAPLDIMFPFKIGLITMDDNYYQYFIKGEGSKYNNFLLGSETTAGYSVGIEGALGVFGSIASTMTTVIIK